MAPSVSVCNLSPFSLSDVISAQWMVMGNIDDLYSNKSSTEYAEHAQGISIGCDYT